MFKIKNEVRLKKNLPEKNLPAGAIGVILHIYLGIKDGLRSYKVQFQNKDFSSIEVVIGENFLEETGKPINI